MSYVPEIFVCENSLPEAYHSALVQLKCSGVVTPCPDWDTTQKEVSLTMVIEHPLAEPRISKCGIFGPRELEQYRQEMLDGILDFEVERGLWHYTYHQRMEQYNQLQFIIDELTRNPYSRRAVITIRDTESDMGNSDPACMQHLQFTIRGGKLNMYTLFRSNDAVKASYMNLFALSCLQERLAKELNVEVGSLTHRVNSYHCYEKDFKLLDSFFDRIMSNSKDDMAYDYEDDWQDTMQEYQDEIADMVNELKNRK